MNNTMPENDLATVLAALRYYQESGMGDPENRSNDIHDIATDGGNVTSLDEFAIDDLCERLKGANATTTKSTIYRLPDDEPLYVVTMGLAVRILAISTDMDEANAAMEADRNLSLLAEHGPFLLLAAKNDLGVRLNTPLTKAPSTSALLVEFDARFGDAVEGDIEIDACDAVGWISEFAPRVRAALDGAA